MAKTDKKEAPVFRNRTKIDQVVYDESYSTLTIPSGKTVKGEWYQRYAGKRNSTFVLVKSGDKEDKQTKNVTPPGGGGSGKGSEEGAKGGSGSEEDAKGAKGGSGSKEEGKGSEEDVKGGSGGKGVENDKDKGTTNNKGKK